MELMLTLFLLFAVFLLLGIGASVWFELYKEWDMWRRNK
jgi:Ca2+/Na+ antiporter